MSERRGLAEHVAHGLRAEPVREVEVVHRGERVRAVGASRGVHARAVAEVGRAPRLVERRPDLHAVAVGLDDLVRIVPEAQRGVARGPAACVLEPLREVPVVHRGDRVDARPEQPVDERS